MTGHVDGHQYRMRSHRAFEDDNVLADIAKRNIALGEDRVAGAEGKRPAIMSEEGVRPVLCRDCQMEVLRRDWEPGLCRRKACIDLCFRPDHRRTAAVTPLEGRPELDAVGILQILEVEHRFRETELFPLIEADRAAQRQKQCCRHLQESRAVVHLVGPARGVTDHVMIGKTPA